MDREVQQWNTEIFLNTWGNGDAPTAFKTNGGLNYGAVLAVEGIWVKSILNESSTTAVANIE